MHNYFSIPAARYHNSTVTVKCHAHQMDGSSRQVLHSSWQFWCHHVWSCGANAQLLITLHCACWFVSFLANTFDWSCSPQLELNWPRRMACTINALDCQGCHSTKFEWPWENECTTWDEHALHKLKQGTNTTQTNQNLGYVSSLVWINVQSISVHGSYLALTGLHGLLPFADLVSACRSLMAVQMTSISSWPHLAWEQCVWQQLNNADVNSQTLLAHSCLKFIPLLEQILPHSGYLCKLHNHLIDGRLLTSIMWLIYELNANGWCNV